MLDEVMVVAYGTAKKSAFTGSASTIKADKLAERQVSNITNALSGQVLVYKQPAEMVNRVPGLLYVFVVSVRFLPVIIHYM